MLESGVAPGPPRKKESSTMKAPLLDEGSQEVFAISDDGESVCEGVN
jgi:hypothetical protein